MFDRIAPVYDAMNRVMTAGLDVRWRRLAAAAVVRPGDRVLDAACGTGDLALADLRAGAAARDRARLLARAMLERARRKAPAVEWVEGDLLALPFPDGASTRRRSASASATSPTSSSACASSAACCGPGGRLAILEITQPRGPLQAVLRALVRPPRARCSGRLLPGGDAYTLPARVGARASRPRRSWRRCCATPASPTCASACSAARSSRSTPGAATR